MLPKLYVAIVTVCNALKPASSLPFAFLPEFMTASFTTCGAALQCCQCLRHVTFLLLPPGWLLVDIIFLCQDESLAPSFPCVTSTSHCNCIIGNVTSLDHRCCRGCVIAIASLFLRRWPLMCYHRALAAATSHHAIVAMPLPSHHHCSLAIAKGTLSLPKSHHHHCCPYYVAIVVVASSLHHRGTIAIPSTVVTSSLLRSRRLWMMQRYCHSHSAHMKVIVVLAFVIARWIHLSGHSHDSLLHRSRPYASRHLYGCFLLPLPPTTVVCSI